MARRHRREKSSEQPWEIEGVSEEAQAVAAKAAIDGGVPLEIWLADTVLRASQEGMAGSELKTFSATSRRTTP